MGVEVDGAHIIEEMANALMGRRVPVDASTVGELCRRHHIVKLSLFGSVLGADFRPESDVDVLVEFEAGKAPGYFRFAQIGFELEELFGRSVDLHTPRSLSRFFRDDVLRGAEPIYGAA